MKKRDQKRTLKLNTEIVRTIANNELRSVGGGDDTATRNVCSKECRIFFYH